MRTLPMHNVYIVSVFYDVNTMHINYCAAIRYLLLIQANYDNALQIIINK
jgi:hypothetical protein